MHQSEMRPEGTAVVIEDDDMVGPSESLRDGVRAQAG
jgi:hypothetical protein